MIPGVVIAHGVVRAIMQLDKLEFKTWLEGMAVSFTLTLILVTSMGFLECAGVPQLNGIYISLIMVVLWLFGKL